MTTYQEPDSKLDFLIYLGMSPLLRMGTVDGLFKEGCRAVLGIRRVLGRSEK